MRYKNLQETYPIFYDRNLEPNWIKMNTSITWQTLIPIYVFLLDNYYNYYIDNVKCICHFITEIRAMTKDTEVEW